MTPTDATVRNRWLAMVGTRLGASAGAVLGVVLIGRADDWSTKILGTAIVLAALWVMAVVPRAMAHKWRTPPGA
jgi:hypothetical protein